MKNISIFCHIHLLSSWSYFHNHIHHNLQNVLLLKIYILNFHGLKFHLNFVTLNDGYEKKFNIKEFQVNYSWLYTFKLMKFFNNKKENCGRNLVYFSGYNSSSCASNLFLHHFVSPDDFENSPEIGNNSQFSHKN